MRTSTSSSTLRPLRDTLFCISCTAVPAYREGACYVLNIGWHTFGCSGILRASSTEIPFGQLGPLHPAMHTTFGSHTIPEWQSHNVVTRAWKPIPQEHATPKSDPIPWPRSPFPPPPDCAYSSIPALRHPCAANVHIFRYIDLIARTDTLRTDSAEKRMKTLACLLLPKQAPRGSLDASMGSPLHPHSTVL